MDVMGIIFIVAKDQKIFKPDEVCMGGKMITHVVKETRLPLIIGVVI